MGQVLTGTKMSLEMKLATSELLVPVPTWCDGCWFLEIAIYVGWFLLWLEAVMISQTRHELENDTVELGRVSRTGPYTSPGRDVGVTTTT